MTQQFHIIGSVYRSLIDILKEDGRLPEELSNQTGTNVENLSASKNMLALEQVSTLWELGFQARGEKIGLDVAARVRLIDFQDVGVFFTATENVADLLHQLANYSALFSNVTEFIASDTATGTEVKVHYYATVSLLHERLDFLSLAGRVLASQYLSTPLKLSKVELTRPKPADTTPWDEAFGVKVAWNAPITRYEVTKEEASRPILTRNEQIKRELQLLLDQRLLDNKNTHPLDHVRAVMAKQFVRDVPTVDSVAATLHVSKRTLQRRLSDSGSSFNDLLSGIREDMAKKYIGLGIPVEMVSERLGYSDLPTFNRAFKRWTGLTASQYLAETK